MLKDEQIINEVCEKIKSLYKRFIENNNKNIQDKFSGEKYNYVSNYQDEII